MTRPARKSSIVIASRGLWLPFSLRIKIIPIGTPAAAKAAASCDAGLPSCSAGIPSSAAPRLERSLDRGIDLSHRRARLRPAMKAHTAPLLDAGDDRIDLPVEVGQNGLVVRPDIEAEVECRPGRWSCRARRYRCGIGRSCRPSARRSHHAPPTRDRAPWQIRHPPSPHRDGNGAAGRHGRCCLRCAHRDIGSCREFLCRSPTGRPAATRLGACSMCSSR